MVTISALAAQKAQELIAKELESMADKPIKYGIRLFVQGGGCSGFQYGLLLDTANEEDEVFECGDILVIVDRMSLRYVDGTEIDCTDNLMGGGFTLKNPNATSSCGCGHSFNTGDDPDKNSGA